LVELPKNEYATIAHGDAYDSSDRKSNSAHLSLVFAIMLHAFYDLYVSLWLQETVLPQMPCKY